jgi:hypothetical protein
VDHAGWLTVVSPPSGEMRFYAQEVDAPTGNAIDLARAIDRGRVVGERSRGVGDRRSRGVAQAVAGRGHGGTAKERSFDASPRAPASGRQDESGRCGAYDGIVVVYGMTAYRPACVASADLTHGSGVRGRFDAWS